ncbi:hypothetical protein [Mycobacterium ahvazicum]|uniref:hypothetical protein n=1 Tax=Mycobacterium ahvazicum TaxID=1964395 RepID=UPI0013FE272F|nr:hypothetical protein [Mycobacterium ahvazicum]
MASDPVGKTGGELMTHVESVPVQCFSDDRLTALGARPDGDIVHCRHRDNQQGHRIVVANPNIPSGNIIERTA